MADIIGIAIPNELKDLTLPSPEEMSFWNLRQQRTFFIDYEIDETYSLMELAKEIVRINNEEKDIENPEPIKLFIHSYGGDLRQAIFFCDLIQSSHVPVITIACGAAMSAGLLIFLAGKRRYAFKHSKVMMHKGSSENAGSYQEMDNAQREFKRDVAVIKEYVLSRTNIYENTYEKKTGSKDWYVFGEDLIKFGIVDKIIENYSEIK